MRQSCRAAFTPQGCTSGTNGGRQIQSLVYLIGAQKHGMKWGVVFSAVIAIGQKFRTGQAFREILFKVREARLMPAPLHKYLAIDTVGLMLQSFSFLMSYP